MGNCQAKITTPEEAFCFCYVKVASNKNPALKTAMKSTCLSDHVLNGLQGKVDRPAVLGEFHAMAKARKFTLLQVLAILTISDPFDRVISDPKWRELVKSAFAAM